MRPPQRSYRIAGALLLLLTRLEPSARGQTPPHLSYTPPADLYHSALRPPEVYESTKINASIHVYDFRSAPADVVDRFRRTMLREWITPQYQETQLAGPPTFAVWPAMPGADAVHYAQFSEVQSFGGGARPRLRVLIVAGSAAAILDLQAQSPQAWSVAYPSFQALISTIRVDAGGRTTRSETPAMRSYAGLYVGTKPKFISVIGAGVGAGSGGFVQATHLYLFSADGRVYRAYDGISAPGGDPRRFDFDEAARADPVNSGVYTVTGNQLTIQMGERQDEVTVVPLESGRVTIGTVTYVRQ